MYSFNKENYMVYHIFIGYDDREHEPYLVAKHSLEKHATVPIEVHKLHHKDLRKSGLFTREWTINKDGQYICNVDGKPFSTQFSHTRFLVPELWRHLPSTSKSPLVMFVDCDFVWLSDIGRMFEQIEKNRVRNHNKAGLYCVKHNYKSQNQTKMDGISQDAYNMKLWSAMMVFNMDCKDNEHLIPELVNTESGRFLHNFSWIPDIKTIENIDESWHYVPNHSEKNTPHIDSIHYTEGGPWFPNYRPCRYGDVWWKYYNDYLKSKLLDCSFDVEGIIDG